MIAINKKPFNPAPLADLQLYGSYSRMKSDGTKESFDELGDRYLLAPESGLFAIGKFTPEEQKIIELEFRNKRAFGSARFMWCGGTDWLKDPKNWYGVFNCVSRNLKEPSDFGLLMQLGMMGCGTGAVLEPKYIDQLPPVVNYLDLIVAGEPGEGDRAPEQTEIEVFGDEPDSGVWQPEYTIYVGDSREGWVQAYQALIDLAMNKRYVSSQGTTYISITVNISGIRPMGTPIKGFGGTANPQKLGLMFNRVAEVLNSAVGRKLNSVECCLLIDEPAACIQAGGVRRFAGIKQFNSKDQLAITAKQNLWQQDANGNWRIDPKREALQASNHTRIFHDRPTLEECIESVRLQWLSGEGAIMWAGEAIARANADLLDSDRHKFAFLNLYPAQEAKEFLAELYYDKHHEVISSKELDNRCSRVGLNPCFSGDMRLLTSEGYKRFDELSDTEPFIVNLEGDIVQSKVWCSGEKTTVALKLTNHQEIICTPDHVFLTTEGEFPAANCKNKQLTPYLKRPEHDVEFVVLGFVQGDGITTKLHEFNSSQVIVNIGKDDHDMLSVFDDADYTYRWDGNRHIYVDGLKQKLIQAGFQSKILPERSLPTEYKAWNKAQKAAFLNGLYSANGCVINVGRVSFKSSCKLLIEELQETLKSDFGIECYYTTNKSKPVEFSNGVYQCRESYDLNIQHYESRLIFFNEINFSLDYRYEKLARTILKNAPVVHSVKAHEVVKVYDFTEPITNWGVVEGFVVHNCAEKISVENLCNLSTVALANINPHNNHEQEQAFKAASLQAAALLQKGFDDDRFQYSREIDPIVIVSFTESYDFFARAFGPDWVRWWAAGRPKNWGDLKYVDLGCDGKTGRYLGSTLMNKAEAFIFQEQEYLTRWKNIVHETVWNYCDRHNIRRPNRCTGLKPEGSLTLLTGIGCCGVHPPKSWRYIRRKEFRKDDPVALAAIDYGYSVKPLRGDKDENGNLLNDPWHPNCTGWAVEVPVEEPLIHQYPEIEQYNPSDFSAKAQFDWFMQVQQHYCTHNLSSTLELRENEIEEVGTLVYNAIQNNEGYVSMAMLGRFDNISVYPRLPFEPISKEIFEQEMAAIASRQKSSDFNALLAKHLNGVELSPNDGACDALGCQL